MRRVASLVPTGTRILPRVRLSDRALFWVFLAVMGALVLLDVGIATNKDATWWAAWGQWAGAVGSVAAAGAAVWIAVQGWRRSDQQARELQEREAASKFGAWIEIGEDSNAEPEVYVTNSGALPVYDVTLYFDFPIFRLSDSVAWMVGDYDTDTHKIGTVGPRDPAEDTDASAFLSERLDTRIKDGLGVPAVVGEGLIGYRYTDAAQDRREVLLHECRLTITFRDSNGAKWARSDRGDLVTRPTTEWEQLTEGEVPPSMAKFLPAGRPHGRPKRP